MKYHLKKISIFLLAFCLLLTSTGINNIKAVSQIEIFPNPKELNSKNEIITPGTSVNLLSSDNADATALDNLSKLLTKKEILVNEDLNSEDLMIIMIEDGQKSQLMDAYLADLSLKDLAQKKSESYELIIQDKLIVINAKDDRGSFYAVKTLEQLFTGETLPEIRVYDEPTMSKRGTIEGFYGTNWSTTERIDQMKFYGDLKLNTYIYAPKDDPYHRQNWRTPYPQAQLDELVKVIQAAKANKVDFVFGISPGNTISLTSDTDFELLLQKAQQLYDVGVRHYAIFFDDIGNRDGINQAKILNRFQSEFVEAKEDVEYLITVPTEYNTFDMQLDGAIKQYTRDFSNTIDPDIYVMWTGGLVVPDGMSEDNAKFVHDLYGDNIAVWWNYPVTDYQRQKLALGPVIDIESGISKYVDYFVVNPMEYADMSKISIGTSADFAWHTEDYNADLAWFKTMQILFGDLSPSMYKLAEHSSRLTGGWTIGRHEAQQLNIIIDMYWSLVNNPDFLVFYKEEIANELDKIILAMDDLLANLPAQYLEEARLNIQKLKLLAQTSNLALDMVEKQLAEEDYQALRNQILTSGYKSGKQISESTLVKFIDDALSFDPNPIPNFEVSNTLINVNEQVIVKNKSNVVSNEFEWTHPGAKVVSKSDDELILSYPKEGRYTISLLAKNDRGEAVEEKKNIITVSSLASESQTNIALRQRASATSTCYWAEGASQAVDGSLNTKWCGAPNSYQTHALTISLSEQSLINSFVIQHAEMGKEPVGMNSRDFNIYLSDDNQNWQKVVSVTGNEAGLTEHIIPVQHAKHVKLEITKPTQGDDKAARIYEFEVYGINGIQTLPEEYDTDENVPTPINTAELEAKLDEARELNLENNTLASKEALEKAIKDAQDVLDDVDKTQEMVDKAFENLVGAIDALEEIVEPEPEPEPELPTGPIGVEVRGLNNLRLNNIKVDLVNSEGFVYSGTFNEANQWLVRHDSALSPDTYTIKLSNLPKGLVAVVNESVASQKAKETDDRNVFSIQLKDSKTRIWGAFKLVDEKSLARYTDVDFDHWAYDVIEAISKREIVEGYDDGTFRPDAQVSRAEVAKMVVVELGLDTTALVSEFEDVEKNHWANAYIAAAHKAGIIEGYRDGSFKPDAQITRAEAATLLQKAYLIENGQKELDFIDVKVDAWYYDAVMALASHDYVLGYMDGSFRPENKVTRAEFSAMLARLIVK